MCCISLIMSHIREGVHSPHPRASALQYAELKPVECQSFADAVALREKQATEILTQVGVLYCTMHADRLHGGCSDLSQINDSGRKWKRECGCETGWRLDLALCGWSE